MNDRAFPASDPEILRLINKRASLGRGPIFVVFNCPTDLNTIKATLNHAVVAGVIAPDEITAKQSNDPVAVSYHFKSFAARWSLPEARARTAVVLGEGGSIGLGIAWVAFRHGVTNFEFVEPNSGAVTRFSLVRLVARAISHRAHNMLLYWIRQFIDWVKMRPFCRRQVFSFRLGRMFRRSRRTRPKTDVKANTVLLIIQNLAAGGSERQAVNVALTLKRLGHFHPIVVCSRLSSTGADFYRQLIKNAGIEVVDLYKLTATDAVKADYGRQFDLCSPDDAESSFQFQEDILRYMMAFSQFKPKIIHSFLDENNVKAGIAAVLMHVPKIILSVRSVAPDNFKSLIRSYMLPGYKALLRQRGVVLCCNSCAGARDYKRWLGRPSLRIPVVSNGVDFQAFAARNGIDLAARERWQIPPDALVVISVMRHSEEKQPGLWARVAIEISRRQANVFFVLVGDGPLRSDVERMLEQASITDRVRVIPQTPEVPALLRASDLFLLTSRLEGLPNVLIEAQAVGVPIVTTPAGGAVEALDPGVTGLIAPNHSVSGVTDTCLTLLTDDDLLARMSKAAPEFVRRKFSLDRMLADTMQLYEA
jgi:glycosyltransferase involved in cell wall biosynthesis